MTGLDVIISVIRTRASANTAIGSALARVGLGLDEWFRLSVLHATPAGGIDRATMAASLGLSGSETIRAVKPLEKLGWVERSDVGRFLLTDSGRRLLVEANAIAASAVGPWLTNGLTEADREGLSELVGRLRP